MIFCNICCLSILVNIRLIIWYIELRFYECCHSCYIDNISLKGFMLSILLHASSPYKFFVHSKSFKVDNIFSLYCWIIIVLLSEQPIYSAPRLWKFSSLFVYNLLDCNCWSLFLMNVGNFLLNFPPLTFKY